MVIVDIALALICFSGNGEEPVCHHALIGSTTPTGTFTLQQRIVNDPLYGGDVLQFKEDPKEIFAIHRVWLGNPKERRTQRLASAKAAYRKITKGCINVSPEVYEMLLKCCYKDTIVIK